MVDSYVAIGLGVVLIMVSMAVDILYGGSLPSHLQDVSIKGVMFAVILIAAGILRNTYEQYLKK